MVEQHINHHLNVHRWILNSMINMGMIANDMEDHKPNPHRVMIGTETLVITVEDLTRLMEDPVEVVAAAVGVGQEILIHEKCEGLLLIIIKREILGILIILRQRSIHLHQQIIEEAGMLIHLLWIMLEEHLMMKGIREGHLWILNLPLEQSQDIEIYHLGTITERKGNLMDQIIWTLITMITGYSSHENCIDIRLVIPVLWIVPWIIPLAHHMIMMIVTRNVLEVL